MLHPVLRSGLAVLASIVLSCSLSARAQDYPNKAIRLVSPYAAGGGTDISLNLLRDRLTKKWGQPVIVEYRPGAAGNIGMESVFRSPPDGYTLLLMPTSPLAASKFLYSKLSFDPDGFVPVSMVADVPNVLLVHPRLPIETVQQFMDYAKANPGKLNYANSSNGGITHLALESLQTLTGIKLTKIPFSGNAPAVTALLGGHVDMTLMVMNLALPHIKAGSVRAIAVTSDKRSSLLPNVPTLAETYPGFIWRNASGVLAPPGTPPAIINKLGAEIAEIMRDADVAKRYLEVSSLAVGNTPAEFSLYLKQESEAIGKAIRQLGLKLD